MARNEWYLPHLRLAYGLTPDQARSWGLFLSRGITDFEPALFCEPGMFMLLPDHTLYAAFVQSVSYLRPRFDDLLQVLDHLAQRDYGIRGNA